MLRAALAVLALASACSPDHSSSAPETDPVVSAASASTSEPGMQVSEPVRLGSLVGRVLFDRGSRRVDVLVYRRATLDAALGGSGIPISPVKAVPDGDGRFEVRELEPGPHLVTFRVDGSSLHVPAFEVVIFPGDAPTVDRRLDPLDLRGVTRRFVLEVLDPDGEPVEGAMVWVGFDDVPVTLLERLDPDEFQRNPLSGSPILETEGGAVMWTAAAARCWATVTAEGYRRAEVESIDGFDRVTLRPPIRVRIPLPEPLEAHDDVEFCAMLARTGESVDISPHLGFGHGDWIHDVRLGAEPAELELERPGQFGVGWSIRRAGDEAGAWIGIEAPSFQTVTIEDLDEPRTLGLAPPRESAVREAIARLP